MQKTTNYELNKPEATDQYNIEHFNDNADTIDAQMKANADAISSLDSAAMKKANNLSDLDNKSTAMTNIIDSYTAASDANVNSDNIEVMTRKVETGNVITWYKTKFSSFWNYINGKISSVLGLTATNYHGKANTAISAGALTTARSIDGVAFDGSANIIHYTTCDLSANTSNKQILVPGFSLVTGAVLFVKFTNGNTAASPTLTVIASSGATGVSKEIRTLAGTALNSAESVWRAGEVAEFVYEGSVWLLVNLGRLPSTGGAVSGTLVLSKTQDASGTTNNSPALIVGGTATQAHIEMDANEIMAKSNGTTPTDLYINSDGGNVHIGKNNGLTIDESGNATATKFIGALQGNATSATSATTAGKLGSSTLGSTTKPVYLSSGTATECSTYAGGTKVTLNGTNKAGTTASFYAPTSYGTSGKILKANGSGSNPTWVYPFTLTSTSKITFSGTGWVDVLQYDNDIDNSLFVVHLQTSSSGSPYVMHVFGFEISDGTIVVQERYSQTIEVRADHGYIQVRHTGNGGVAKVWQLNGNVTLF